MLRSKQEQGAKTSDELRESEASRQIRRQVALMRLAGAVLLVAGWAYFTIPQAGSPEFLLNTLVFAALGAAAFSLAYNARRHSTTIEKRLRLSLIKRNMELESMGTRDGLTYLFNRRHLFDRFERELETTKTLSRPLSLLLIEVAGMKEINSTHGYRFGDAYLTHFGRFLAEQSRASDVPARIGGDEFAVLLPDTTEHAASAARTRLLRALEKAAPFAQGDASVKLTASVAVAGYPWSADTIDGIMRVAVESIGEQREEKAPIAISGTLPSEVSG